MDIRMRIAWLVRKLAAKYPLPAKSAKVTIEYVDGEVEKIPLGLASVVEQQHEKEKSKRTNAGAAKRRFDAELVVFKSFPAPGQPGITVKAAFGRSGHSALPHFRKIAKRIRDAGFIEKEQGSDGRYRQTTIGVAAFASR